MQASLDRSIVLDALQAALSQRQTDMNQEQAILHHSDRASQRPWQSVCKRRVSADALRERHPVQYESKGKSKRKPLSLRWDNAPVESFFGTLKQELIHRRSFATRQHARQEVFDYIEIWYNRQRRHSALGYISPEEFEKRASRTKTLVA